MSVSSLGVGPRCAHCHTRRSASDWTERRPEPRGLVTGKGTWAAGGAGLLVLLAGIVVADANGWAAGGIILSGAALCYWYHLYAAAGLDTRPRVTLTEIMVLYIGMSVEVGLLVEVCRSGNEQIGISAMLLPPALIYTVALMDQSPGPKPVYVRLRKTSRGRSGSPGSGK